MRCSRGLAARGMLGSTVKVRRRVHPRLMTLTSGDASRSAAWVQTSTNQTSSRERSGSPAPSGFRACFSTCIVISCRTSFSKRCSPIARRAHSSSAPKPEALRSSNHVPMSSRIASRSCAE